MPKTFSIFRKGPKRNFNIDNAKDNVEKKKVDEIPRAESSVKKLKIRKKEERKTADSTYYEDTVNYRPISSVENDEKLNTATLNSIEQSQNRKKIVRIILLVLFILVFLSIFVYICFRMFLKVETVRILNLEYYDENEVIEAAGIEPGTQMYDIDKDAVSKKIIAMLPYIKSVNITRELPSTIIISVEEDSAKYVARFVNRNCILSESMRVLEVLDDDDERFDENYSSLLSLSLPQVSYAILGSKIEFYDSSSYSFMNDVIDSLVNSGAGDRITHIDLYDRFNLGFEYDGRIYIELGDFEEIEAKVEFALKIISEYGERAKGKITVRDSKTGYAVIE